MDVMEVDLELAKLMLLDAIPLLLPGLELERALDVEVAAGMLDTVLVLAAEEEEDCDPAPALLEIVGVTELDNVNDRLGVLDVMEMLVDCDEDDAGNTTEEIALDPSDVVELAKLIPALLVGAAKLLEVDCGAEESEATEEDVKRLESEDMELRVASSDEVTVVDELRNVVDRGLLLPIDVTGPMLVLAPVLARLAVGELDTVNVLRLVNEMEEAVTTELLVMIDERLVDELDDAMNELELETGTWLKLYICRKLPLPQNCT